MNTNIYFKWRCNPSSKDCNFCCAQTRHGDGVCVKLSDTYVCECVYNIYYQIQIK